MGGRSYGAGDPFDGPERPQNPGLIAFLDIISRNREPADIAPIGPRRYHGSTRAVQVFGHGSQPARVNSPGELSGESVPLAQSAVHRSPQRVPSPSPVVRR